MKKATTPWTQVILDMPNRIDDNYLISRGFELVEEKPLFNRYQHKSNRLLFVVIGMYGELCIAEKHWCNDEVERIFSTINRDIKRWEFDILLKYLNINI